MCRCILEVHIEGSYLTTVYHRNKKICKAYFFIKLSLNWVSDTSAENIWMEDIKNNYEKKIGTKKDEDKIMN